MPIDPQRPDGDRPEIPPQITARAPAGASDQKYRRDIDGLRAVAVLSVVFSHAGFPGFPGGFVGVDIFFVISGFLITGILLRDIEAGKFSLLNFYERRARRILPALLLVLSATLIAGYALLLPAEYIGLSKSMLATLTFTSNFWFLHATGNYFGTAAELQPLLHTWSLAVEEQFYIFFPLLLLALLQQSRRILILVAVGLSGLSLALSLWATARYPDFNFFLMPTRIWELGLGVALALLNNAPIRNRLMVEITAIAGLLAILASILLITSETPFPGGTALPTCLGTAAIIWSGGLQKTLVARLLSMRLPVAIGLVSYSLYLWHWPLLVYARVFTGELHLPAGIAVMMVLLGLALACLSWRFVEQPFRRGLGRLRLSRRMVFWSSGLSGAAMACLAAALIAGNGLPSRLPPGMLTVYDEARERSDLDVRCLKQPGICVLGAGGSAPPTHFLWGDSHAAALAPGFDAWFRDQGIAGRFAAKTACPPLSGVIRLDARPDHGCDRFNEDILRYLAATPSITDVVLVARWALAANGTRPPGESEGPAVLAISPRAEPAPELAGNAAVFAFGFQKTVDTLVENGKRVTVIGGIPEIGFDVPAAYIQDRFRGLKPPAPPSKQDYMARQRLADTLMSKRLPGRPASLIGVADIFCPEDCSTRAEGHLLYRDDDHLSVWGADWLVRRLGLFNVQVSEVEYRTGTPGKIATSLAGLRAGPQAAAGFNR